MHFVNHTFYQNTAFGIMYGHNLIYK